MNADASETDTAWDAGRYDRQFGYVSALGRGVIDLLDARPGERVLDLGCGTGELLEQIAARGAAVIGVDSDPAMVAAASRRLGLQMVHADGHDFTVDEPVDAVFSNAALHWMASDPEGVVRRVRAALRPGGRFVAEMGGAGNVERILDALRAAFSDVAPGTEPRVPWYFPSAGEYSMLLERNGFRVSLLQHFDRPTELVDCPDGLADWVRMFGAGMLEPLTPADRRVVVEQVVERCRAQLQRGGAWYVDYVRLRFVAVAGASTRAA